MYIGVIYCVSDGMARRSDWEKLADEEVFVTARAVKAALEKADHTVEMVSIQPAGMEELKGFDWVFNLTESTFGFPLADYETAEILERLGIRFTGAGSTALKECLDKECTKKKLLSHQIHTPAFEVYHPGDRIRSKLRFPLFVKPVHEDGSIGITDNSIVSSRETLACKIRQVHEIYKQAALVEEYIEGREITASIIGNGDNLIVLPLSENVFTRYEGASILSYEAKWISSSKAYQNISLQCPCQLSRDVEANIREISHKVCKLMNCRDYTRIDYRLKGDIPYILEVNPNPCIYPDEYGFSRAALEGGFSYDELIQKILTCSIERWTLAATVPQRGNLYEDPVTRLRERGPIQDRRDFIQD